MQNKFIFRFKFNLISTALCVTLCAGCSSKADTEAVDSSQAEAVSTEASAEETAVTEAADKEEAARKDTEITIPSVLVGDEVEQLEDDTDIAATNNDDGTVTYSLDNSEVDEILVQIAAEIDDSIQVILDDDDRYPNIVSITPNEDYTCFTIALKDGQMGTYEAMLVMSFYTVGNRYQIYNGVPSDEASTTVIYTNDSDGSIISEMVSTPETFSSQ